MKRKKKNWDAIRWTPFEPREVDQRMGPKSPAEVFVNSIYQVSVWYDLNPVFGPTAHLSIKTHDKAARHDWRELQRIKNELCGPECEAVELYPAESRVVDTSNQYHLFVFQRLKLPLGFKDRLVSEGEAENFPGTARQRPWRPELKPPDAISKEEVDQLQADFLERMQRLTGG